MHAANGEYAEISQYLDLLDDNLTNVKPIIKTGNKMVDAILNKLFLAVKKQICIKAEAKISASLSTSELDLCFIIGTLMDNARDVCE